jgi:hypothetical protein
LVVFRHDFPYFPQFGTLFLGGTLSSALTAVLAWVRPSLLTHTSNPADNSSSDGSRSGSGVNPESVKVWRRRYLRRLRRCEGVSSAASVGRACEQEGVCEEKMEPPADQLVHYWSGLLGAGSKALQGVQVRSTT